MIYLADTADINQLKKLFYYLPIEGITTNPTIMAHAGKKLSILFPELLEIVGDKMLHVQVISSTADAMVKEVKTYINMFGLGDNFYAKIPVSREGYRAMKKIKDMGVNVTATAIFTQQQALVAARCGADFVAPYINRLDSISSHGIGVVENIVRNFNDFNIPCKVLAASFKTVDQVHRASMSGAHSATISYDILEALRSHPMTDMSIEGFERDGSALYDIPIA